MNEPFKRDDPMQVALLAHASMAYFWTRTNRLKEITNLLRAAGVWPGIAYEPDPTGMRISRDGASLGLLRWNGRLDLPFGGDDPSTDGVVFDVRTSDDVDRALWLLRLAYSTSNLRV